MHTHTEVDVKSPALRDILIEINKDVEGLSLLKEPPFVSWSSSWSDVLPFCGPEAVLQHPLEVACVNISVLLLTQAL